VTESSRKHGSKTAKEAGSGIDVKNEFFYGFNVFFTFQTFLFLKKRWQSSERQAG